MLGLAFRPNHFPDSAPQEIKERLESLGDTNINDKFENINSKPSFLSTIWGVYICIYIYIYAYIYMYIYREIYVVVV